MTTLISAEPATHVGAKPLLAGRRTPREHILGEYCHPRHAGTGHVSVSELGTGLAIAGALVTVVTRWLRQRIALSNEARPVAGGSATTSGLSASRQANLDPWWW